MRALKGSCVVIPCTFNYPGTKRPSHDIRAIWYRDGGETFCDSDHSSNGRADLVGDRGEKNCSLQINGIRTEDAKEFTFRVEIKNLDSYSFLDSKVRIEVEGKTFGSILMNLVSPAAAAVWVDGQNCYLFLGPGPLGLFFFFFLDSAAVPEISCLDAPCPKEITENVTVTVTCTTSHTCPAAPPGLTWNGAQGPSTVQHRPLQDGLWEVSSTLTFTPSYTDHGKSLTCQVMYSGGKWTESSIELRVMYAPKDVKLTSRSRMDGIAEGNDVSLVCSSNSYPLATEYTWSKTLGNKTIMLGEKEETITVHKISRDGGLYHCAARNKIGATRSNPLNLTVQCKYPGRRKPTGQI
ncbi:sialoadhesin-like [Latimeria chalumnae]|uniref:sialoadhesin-like n=1 Tax=Latimeria chalumnae TaxID=7897 RepID=UPI00313E577D